MRSEVDDEGRVLLVAHHSIYGGLGIFIPNDAPEVSANQDVRLSGTRVKVAPAPESLEESQNIKGIVALEDPQANPRRKKGRIRRRSEERRVGKECRSRWSPYH